MMSPVQRSTRRARWARRARAAQRGVTVYVVVLVIAMLSAVGVFAAKSASLALEQGGHVRQAMQTHYVAEYSVDAALAAIGTDVPGYVQEFEQFDDDYIASEAGAGDALEGWRSCATATVTNTRCYKFGRAGLESRFDGRTLLDAPTLGAGQTLGTPGSLGRANVDAHFVVEATDLAQLMAPMAGQRASGAPVAFYTVTLSATGDVSPPVDTAGSSEDQFRTGAMSLESARVQVTLGPVPAR